MAQRYNAIRSPIRAAFGPLTDLVDNDETNHNGGIYVSPNQAILSLGPFAGLDHYSTQQLILANNEPQYAPTQLSKTARRRRRRKLEKFNQTQELLEAATVIQPVLAHSIASSSASLAKPLYTLKSPSNRYIYEEKDNNLNDTGELHGEIKALKAELSKLRSSSAAHKPIRKFERNAWKSIRSKPGSSIAEEMKRLHIDDNSLIALDKETQKELDFAPFIKAVSPDYYPAVNSGRSSASSSGSNTPRGRSSSPSKAKSSMVNGMAGLVNQMKGLQLSKSKARGRNKDEDYRERREDSSERSARSDSDNANSPKALPTYGKNKIGDFTGEDVASDSSSASSSGSSNHSNADWRDSFPYESNIFALSRYYHFMKRLYTCKDAVTYKAVSKLTGEKVAIKLCAGYDGAKDPKEVRILSILQGHRNIVKYLGWHHLPSTRAHAIVTQYISNREVKASLWGKPDKIRMYMKDVISALLHMHKSNILYRDIKPSNCLWDAEHEKAYIIDYDVATIFDQKRLHRSMVGTDGFIAPEALEISAARRQKQRLPYKGYDFSVDSYSAGILLASLIFEIDEDAVADLQIAQTKGPALREKCIKLKGTKYFDHVHDLLIQMLHSDPDKRMSLAECLQHDYFHRSIKPCKANRHTRYYSRSRSVSRENSRQRSRSASPRERSKSAAAPRNSYGRAKKSVDLSSLAGVVAAKQEDKTKNSAVSALAAAAFGAAGGKEGNSTAGRRNHSRDEPKSILAGKDKNSSSSVAQSKASVIDSFAASAFGSNNSMSKEVKSAAKKEEIKETKANVVNALFGMNNKANEKPQAKRGEEQTIKPNVLNAMFGGNVQGKSSAKLPLCDICDANVAVVHCAQCEMNLCEAGGCNKDLHKTEKMRYHKTTPLANNNTTSKQQQETTTKSSILNMFGASVGSSTASKSNLNADNNSKNKPAARPGRSRSISISGSEASSSSRSPSTSPHNKNRGKSSAPSAGLSGLASAVTSAFSGAFNKK
jgi:serine/threonine protein kinase